MGDTGAQRAVPVALAATGVRWALLPASRPASAETALAPVNSGLIPTPYDDRSTLGRPRPPESLAVPTAETRMG